MDVDNCFDQVSHVIAFLIFHSFGVTQEATGAMLKTKQEMKFFLWTAFRDLTDFAGLIFGIKT